MTAIAALTHQRDIAGPPETGRTRLPYETRNEDQRVSSRDAGPAASDGVYDDGWWRFVSLSQRRRASAPPHVAARAARRGDVGVTDVVDHHAIRAETPAQCANRPLHARNPAARQAIAIAVVVQRYH